MNKYFAYDALEREFTTHDTLQEAKSQAQDYVDHTFDIGADNGFGDDLEDGIKETCFGVVLGGFDLPTRPLTEEEKEFYADEFTYMVEYPVLVEYPQNKWIKCSERLPEPNTRVLIYSLNKEVGVALYQELTGFGYIPFYGEVTHWQPLPQPPLE